MVGIIYDNDVDGALMKELAALGQVHDDAIDPAATALLFAALDHPGIVLERYQSHLRALADDTAACHATLLQEGAEDNAETRLSALRVTLFSDHGYTGDEQDYNNLDNADLMRVIDRRRGMPIALAILYISTARAQGWTAHGLNLPGHFLARLDYGPQRVIFDPFYGGKIMNAADIRAQLKSVMGPTAELSADYYNPADNRDILIRLQNNRKIRLIEAEDYEGALATVMALRALAPG
ncbi:MAG: transglutaminase-like domain-containing protein, partial [Alphaproteobacteria bacterium]|nr:transglutaminase-like domain-containing protein [Alphaproteobacteria bacterium]